MIQIFGENFREKMAKGKVTRRSFGKVTAGFFSTFFST
jgi:hypothetical protein